MKNGRNQQQNKRLGWRFLSVGDALYYGFLVICTGLHWLAAIPIDAVARGLNWLDQLVDREFKKRFGGW